ncbi:MAG: DUF4299 family protein [Erysipelotrichales bacterium]|nr:DUF4299 family protein [Erysipelotrichales bacterium]
MAVSVRIDFKGKKIPSVEEIAALKRLEYGAADRNYMMHGGEIGDYTILCDPQRVGRGFEVYVEDDQLCFSISLPNTPHDIELFYQLLVEICKEYKIPKFTRDNEEVLLISALDCISIDIHTSKKILKDFEAKVRNKDQELVLLFGAYHPISLGEKQFDEIKGEPANLEELLNRLQQKDSYYVNPHLYQKQDGTVFGVYMVGDEDTSIVPTYPYVISADNDIVSAWYVAIPPLHMIPYEHFIKHVRKVEDFDENHIIIELDQETIDYLAKNFAVEI